MTAKRLITLPLVAVLLLVLSPVRAAEEGTVQAILPWDGEGRIFQIDTNRLQFLGELEGIMYAENHEGKLNEAYVQCPIVQILDLEAGKTEAVGHCEITVGPEDVVYARMDCEGVPGGGGCTGSFKLIDGEGRFAGVTGEGSLRVRSPLRAIAGGLGSGDLVRVATGLAVITDLKFKIP